MPKQETVQLIIDSDPKHPNDPKFASFSMKGPSVQGEMITFTNDANDDGVDVTFVIQDNTGRGYKFPADLSKTLAVKKITDKKHCPKPDDKWPDFSPAARTDSTLTVRNANSYLQYFGFALFVTVDPKNGPYVPYDPIGNNQNGSTYGRNSG